MQFPSFIKTGICAILVLAATVLSSGTYPASAAQTGIVKVTDTASVQKLDELFSRLKRADTGATAYEIEGQIWQTWLQSGASEIDALMNEARGAMSVRRFGVALEALDKIVKLAPDYAEGWNKRATVYWLVNRREDSLADIEKVLSLEPRHFGAISGIALIRLEQGEKEAALAAVHRALAIHPFLRGADDLISRAGGKDSGDPI